MKIEIHTRPLILAKLAGQEDADNAHEVDIWLYTDDPYQCGQVIFESVVPSLGKAEKFISELQFAFRNAEVLKNDVKAELEAPTSLTSA